VNATEVKVSHNDETSQWAPDGRGIAYVNSADGRNIWEGPFDGGAPRALTHLVDARIFNFAFSPDGRRLAMTRGGALSDIVLIKGLR
jgi:Tol biopolymer transport system component